VGERRRRCEARIRESGAEGSERARTTAGGSQDLHGQDGGGDGDARRIKEIEGQLATVARVIQERAGHGARSRTKELERGRELAEKPGVIQDAIGPRTLRARTKEARRAKSRPHAHRLPKSRAEARQAGSLRGEGRRAGHESDTKGGSRRGRQRGDQTPTWARQG